MIEELKKQMSRDLNIYKYNGELSREYNQRLIYSGLASWVRTLLCGNSISDLSDRVDDKFPDIMYVQSNLTKVAEAFIKSFDVDENWIEVEENQNPSSVLASEIIQGMIYLNEIAEINSRQLAPVPIRKCSYKGWTHFYGNDTFDRSCMTLGLAQWSDKVCKEAETVTRIINISGKEYVKYIINNFEWSDSNLSGEYEIFKVGLERRYSKAWILFDENKIDDGLFLLRDAHTFEPGYTLLKKEGKKMSISLLDSWYVESREIYRIMYALNYENGTPAKFRIKEMEEYFILFYPSRLPEEENKLFFSLSWPYSSCHDKFARVFPKQTRKFIVDEIENIGAYISNY